MICIEDKYFSLNRMLFLAIGGWYSQTSVFTLFYNIICSCILITFIIVQLLTFTTSRCNMEIVIKVLSITSLFIGFTWQYYTIIMKREIMKDIFIKIQHIYDELKDEKEIAIFHKHGRIGLRYTTFFIGIFVSNEVLLMITYCGPIILDIILPINESRPHYLLFEVEYFLDQEKYFYLILLHISLATCIGGIASTSIATGFIVFYQGICGIFRIVSYHIEHVMRSDILRDIKENENLTYRGLIYAVYIHCEAVKLSELVISNFEVILIFSYLVTGVILSLNMYQTLQVLLYGGDIKNIVIPLLLVIGMFIYCFVIGYIGQQVIDDNNNIFMTVYNIRWYETPLSIQKLVLFLLQRGNKAVALNIKGSLILSIETFSMQISTALSYFTVLYSIQ